MIHRTPWFILFIAIFAPIAAHGQPLPVSFAAGVQLSTYGPGLTGSVHITPLFSASLDVNLLPLSNRTESIDGIVYDLDPEVVGAVLAANYHPLGTRFSIGLGFVLGGYTLNGTSVPLGSTITIGDQAYPSSAVGTLTGTFETQRPVVAFLIGWRGKGFNLGIGISPLNTTGSIEASGPIGRDSAFQEDVQQEIDNVLQEIERVPVLPYFRIGYQFGF